MKGTIQKWKLVILLDALLFLSNMTFAKDTINQYTEGNPIDTTAVSISDKTNIPDRLYVDSLSLKRHFIHRIGIEARPGYIFPTSSFFRGENLNWKPIENSLSLHLKYSFQFHPNTYNDRIYRGAYQGIGVGYYNMYEKPQLGNPLTVYLFQGARIARFNQRLSLNYEWNFGLSFGWKPFDEQTNPFNTVVGSKINAYINLGLMLNWRFAPRWSLTAGVGLTHFSNGNTRYPNGGVNLIGGRVGLMRTFGRDAADDRRAAVRRSDPFRPYVSYDVILYGALRKKGFLQESRAYLIPGSFAVAGLNFTPMYNFSRFFRAGLSLDAQYDESANLKDHIANDYPLADELKFHRPPFKEQFAVGVSIRCEVVMPIFSINLGIGKNLIGRGDDTNSFYQVFALKADVARNVFLHVGYQLYKFRNPNNLMLGVGYRFNGR